MSFKISTQNLLSEHQYPIKTPNPASAVETIVSALSEIESEIDSESVDSEVDDLDTGGMFMGKASRRCLHIKLNNPRNDELKKLGAVIFPVEFGNLIYLTKYEYIDGDWLDRNWKTQFERTAGIKRQLKNIEDYMQYTFIMTLGDYCFTQLIQRFDPDVDTNLKLYQAFWGEV